MHGYTANIEQLTRENKAFRKVLYTDTKCQLVLMSLLPGEAIGEEVHDVDQFFRIEEGSGAVVLNGERHDLTDGSVIIVPASVKHDVINTGSVPMKLYSLYTPPHHKDGTVHETKQEAEADSEHFDGETTE
jgi:mannose-6-phosphate isomerase-like protein (cupin superfamily)